MDKAFSIINLFFKFTWRIQKLIMKHQVVEHPNYRIFEKLSYFAIIVSACFSFITQYQYLGPLLLIGFLSIILSIVDLFARTFDTFTTVRGFFKNAFAFAFIFFLFSLLLINFYATSLTVAFGKNADTVIYFIIIFTLCLIWSFISSFTNAKVSVLVNAILTVIVSILYQTANFFFTWTDISMLTNDLLLDLSNQNYTEAQFFQFSISFLFLPIVITLATATMVCAMKRYWVDKYNQGDDIGIDYLEKFTK